MEGGKAWVPLVQQGRHVDRGGRDEGGADGKVQDVGEGDSGERIYYAHVSLSLNKESILTYSLQLGIYL